MALIRCMRISATQHNELVSCRVCDFGLSNTLAGVSGEGSSQPGTLIFAAPEILDGGSQNPSSDVYSFGMLAYHLFSMGQLDTDLMEYQVHHQVSRNMRKDICKQASYTLVAWIKKCMIRAPARCRT